MRSQGRRRDEVTPNRLAIGGELPGRLDLLIPPSADLVNQFILTRGAARAWAAINRQLSDRRGGLFWIGGPAGSGKTHFLNYVIALSNWAGALGNEAGRSLALAINLPQPPASVDLPRHLANAIVHELAGERRTDGLWRHLAGMDALHVALDQAKRQGVGTIVIAIDWGLADPLALRPQVALLADFAAAPRTIRLTVIAAGRCSEMGGGITTFNIAPADDEDVVVALGRARECTGMPASTINAAYAGIDLGSDSAAAIFPFHPLALTGLHALAPAQNRITWLAHSLRMALLEWQENPPGAMKCELIWPAAIMHLASVRVVAAARRPATVAALDAVHAEAMKTAVARHALAHEIVDVLALSDLTGEGTPLELGQLKDQLAGSREVAEPARSREMMAVIAELALAIGVIGWDPLTFQVRFNAHAAGVPDLAAFNRALLLTHRFDATLSQVAGPQALAAALERLRRAMAQAVEDAERNRAILQRSAVQSGNDLAPEHLLAITNFIALAEGGPAALFGADTIKRATMAQTFVDYEMVVILAAAAPRLQAMCEYLQAMGLHDLIDDPQRDRLLIKIETDCKLVLVALGAALQAKTPATLDALESRFQRFKWTYVTHYRTAHDRWRQAMSHAAQLVEDGGRFLAALQRLDAIVALGPSLDPVVATRFDALTKRVAVCDLEGSLAPEIVPCCPQCNYILGSASPVEELKDAVTTLRRALEAKLALLSQSAIARLIREHDQTRRLEGFLKITQAAQTDALIRVLDDGLIGYLGRLLEDNCAADADAKPPRPALSSLRTSAEGHHHSPRQPPRGRRA